jgi:urocanate hydratase
MIGHAKGGAIVSTMATISADRLRTSSRSVMPTENFVFQDSCHAYVRPLFCEGKGPFRWAILSGRREDLEVIDNAMLRVFPDDKPLHRWIEKARAKVR